MTRNEFDYTMMSTFLTCRRKYDYRINNGYVRKVAQTAPSFGGAIHKGLDEWFSSKDVAKAVEIFKGAYQENLELDDKRTHKMGEWILTNYDKQYRDQPWELVATEATFNVALPNGKRFIGRRDKIIKWNDCLWLVDHKTTSSLGSTYFYMAEPNLQFVGYAWAARQEGYDIKGLIIDAILVAKGLLPGERKNSNLTALQRYDIYFKQEHFDEWLDIVLKVQRDIKLCEETAEWYPNFNSCVHFGECEYRRVCKEDKDIRQRILDADYEVDFWSPLKEDKA